MKIDFVIPWVDGSDKAWRDEKQKYDTNTPSEDSDGNRYRDWDNLKYWFRGVEKYAPWVNNVFLITWGHIPEWLDVSNKKIVVINHKDYIPEKYLPTFSSHPIELNIHRIQALSEYFVYFNDDMFITGECAERDFFGKNGLPCDLFVEEPPTFVRKEVFNDIIINNLILINNNFDRQEVLARNKNKLYSKKNMKCYIKNKMFSMMKRQEFFGIEFAHLPQPFLKSMFDKVWDENTDILDRVCKNKFRSSEDVNQYVIKYYQYLTGNFEPYNWKKNGIVYQLNDSFDRNNIDQAVNDIKNNKYKMICLNDSAVSRFKDTKDRINAAFESLLPEKCSFEL